MPPLENLLAPIRIRQMELPNRVVMPPMGTNLGNPDGTVSEANLAYLRRRARGGAGLVITEISVVHPTGMVISNELGSYDDRFLPGLRKLAGVIHEAGGKGGPAASPWGTGVLPASEGRESHRPLPDPISGLRPDAPGNDPGRDPGNHPRLRKRRLPGQRSRVRRRRSPRRPRVPSDPVPFRPLQPARRRIRRVPPQTAAALSSRSCRRSAGASARNSPFPCAFPWKSSSRAATPRKIFSRSSPSS